MKPGKYDFVIRQGSTWSQKVVWKDPLGAPVNLSGYTARMQIRPVVQSPTVLVELTTQNGRIALGGANGEITLTLAASITEAIQATSGVYDLELVSAGGIVTAILEGSVTFPREVTR
jgi:hypothetical protein